MSILFGWVGVQALGFAQVHSKHIRSLGLEHQPFAPTSIVSTTQNSAAQLNFPGPGDPGFAAPSGGAAAASAPAAGAGPSAPQAGAAGAAAAGPQQQQQPAEEQEEPPVELVDGGDPRADPGAPLVNKTLPLALQLSHSCRLLCHLSNQIPNHAPHHHHHQQHHHRHQRSRLAAREHPRHAR